MRYPQHLAKALAALQRLPGVGRKTAERFLFEILTWDPEESHAFAQALDSLPEKIAFCPVCGCILDEEECPICEDAKRDVSILCVVASAREIFSIEQTHQYRGLYHVLGGLLSPLSDRGPKSLRLDAIRARLQGSAVREIVLALDSTLEGDATALFLRDELAPFNIPISRPAFGIPLGSALEYVDGGTLARAFSSRITF